jgi:hypothetical protein
MARLPIVIVLTACLFVEALDREYDLPHAHQDFYSPDDGAARSEVGASATTLTASVVSAYSWVVGRQPGRLDCC